MGLRKKVGESLGGFADPRLRRTRLREKERPDDREQAPVLAMQEDRLVLQGLGRPSLRKPDDKSVRVSMFVQVLRRGDGSMAAEAGQQNNQAYQIRHRLECGHRKSPSTAVVMLSLEALYRGTIKLSLT